MAGDDALVYRVFKNQRVQAFANPFLDVFCGGPVLEDPSDARLRLKRVDVPADRFADTADYPDYLSGEWAYIGPKYHHFGHIMAEMVHRAIPTKKFWPHTKYLVVVSRDDPDNQTYYDLPSAYKAFLDYCDISPDDIKIINRNTIVETLFICEQGSSIVGRPGKEYLDLLNDFFKIRLLELHGDDVGYEKIYVSRTDIEYGGTILGESYIEKLLSDEGFIIIHPAKYTLSRQMDIYSKAKLVVFSEGSACHGTELLGSNSLDRVFVLLRRQNALVSYTRLLKPRSKYFGIFRDIFFLGTAVADRTTLRPLQEMGVSLIDSGRIVAYFRRNNLARLDSFDPEQYFATAEQDMKAYFAYHQSHKNQLVDPWELGRLRMEFESIRAQLLGHRAQSGPVVSRLQPGANDDEPDRDDVESIETLAWDAHKQKDWATAAARWHRYRQRLPNDPTAYGLGSVALMNLERFAETEEVLAHGMVLFPDNREIFGNFALLAQNQGRWEDAVRRWQRYGEQFPADARAYSAGSVPLMNLQRYDEADALLCKGMEKFPDNFEICEKFAWVAHNRQDWASASRRWEICRERFPHDPRGYASGAMALIHLRQFDEADEILGLALAKFPDQPEVNSAFAWVAHNREDWHQAAVRWASIRAKFPGMPLGFALGGTSLTAAGLYEEADRLFEEGLAIWPNHPELLERYARRPEYAGAIRQALARWLVLQARYPEHEVAKIHIGRINERLQALEAEPS